MPQSSMADIEEVGQGQWSWSYHSQAAQSTYSAYQMGNGLFLEPLELFSEALLDFGSLNEAV